MSFARYSESLSKMRNFYTYLIFDFRFWGQITPKVKIFENVFPDSATGHRTTFRDQIGENRPLRSCRKVPWITTHKNSGAGLVPAPILPTMGRSRPKFPERCHHLKCQRTPNLVRIGFALPDLFWKALFFGPKSNIIGIEPTIMQGQS